MKWQRPTDSAREAEDELLESYAPSTSIGTMKPRGIQPSISCSAKPESLEKWVQKCAKRFVSQPKLKDALELLRRVAEQDTEPGPLSGGKRIARGVATGRTRFSA